MMRFLFVSSIVFLLLWKLAFCHLPKKQRIVLQSTLKVKKSTVVVNVLARCQLHSQNQGYIKVPTPHRRIRKGHMRIASLVEEGRMVRKGEIIAKIKIIELQKVLKDWQAQVKMARSKVKSAQKKLIAQKCTLEMNVKKNWAIYQQQKLALQLANISWLKTVEKYKKTVAIKEVELGVLQKKQIVNAMEQLQQKNLISKISFAQKMSEYLESKELVQEKIWDLKILQQPDFVQIGQLTHDKDKAKYDWVMAKNELKHQVKKLQYEISKAKKHLFRRIKRVGYIKKFYQKADLRAPCDGIVVYNKIENKRIKKNMRVWQQQQIATVHDLNHMQAAIEIPEHSIHLLKIGQKVEINIDSLNKKFRAKVIEIGKMAKEREISKNKTKMFGNKVFKIIAAIATKDKRLKPKLTGNARVFIKKYQDVFKIPITALSRSGQFVRVVNDTKTYKRRVKVIFSDEKKALVTEGLKAGESILIKISKPQNISSLEKIMETGVVRPKYFQELYAGLSGTLTMIKTEGAFVVKGQKAFVVKPQGNHFEELEIKLDTAKAQLEKTKSIYELTKKQQQMEIKKANLAVKRAAYELEKLLRPKVEEYGKAFQEAKREKILFSIAHREYQMAQTSFKKNIISMGSFFAKELKMQNSKSKWMIAQLKEQLLRKGVPKRQINIAKKKLALAKLNLEQTRKTAQSVIKVQKLALRTSLAELAEDEYQMFFHEKEFPQRGVGKAIEGGFLYYVRGENGKPAIGKEYKEGDLIAIISNETKMVVETKIYESDRHLVQIGQKAFIYLPAFPGKKFSGKIIKIGKVAIDLNEITGLGAKTGVSVFKVIVQVCGHKTLKNGMSAIVEIQRLSYDTN